MQPCAATASVRAWMSDARSGSRFLALRMQGERTIRGLCSRAQRQRGRSRGRGHGGDKQSQLAGSRGESGTALALRMGRLALSAAIDHDVEAERLLDLLRDPPGPFRSLDGGAIRDHLPDRDHD